MGGMPNSHPDEKWTLSDLVALSALGSLARGYVPWTAWSMRPAAVASIVNELQRGRRRTVVELGSGASTVFLGHAVAELGGHVLSVEHDAEYAAHVARLLAREELTGVVTLAVVPLAPWPAPVVPDDGTDDVPDDDGADEVTWRAPESWYDVERLLALCPASVDALVVDGPPAGMHPSTLVREPALGVLRPRLAPDWAVFLDDADRPAERETLRRWSTTLGVELTPIDRITLGAGRAGGGFLPTL
jgi:hypothetical protein